MRGVTRGYSYKQSAVLGSIFPLRRTYPNGHQELVVVDAAATVLVEGIEEFLGVLIAEFQASLNDAFGELFLVKASGAVVVHPAEHSVTPHCGTFRSLTK